MTKSMNQWVRSGLGFVFIFLAVALVSIATSLALDPSKVLTLQFWVVVALKTLVSVITFNLVYWNMMIGKKSDTESSLGKTFADYAKYIGAVYDQKRREEVVKRIDDGNKKRFKETATGMLSRITDAIEYKDLFKEDGSPIDIEALVAKTTKERLLSKKEVRLFRKTLRAVINGRVKYERLDYNHIMLNNDNKEGDRYPKMVVHESKDLAVKNINIVFSSLVISALFTIFALQDDINNLFYEIVANATTIGFAIFNSNIFAIREANKLKNAFQARKDFLCEFIDLSKTPSL